MNKQHCSICKNFGWDSQGGIIALCVAYPEDKAIDKKYKPLHLCGKVDYYDTTPDWCKKFNPGVPGHEELVAGYAAIDTANADQLPPRPPDKAS